LKGRFQTYGRAVLYYLLPRWMTISLRIIGGTRQLPNEEVIKVKDDGRLPMEDHNPRIIVLGKAAAQARAAAEEMAKNAFHNVSFYWGFSRGPEAGKKLSPCRGNVVCRRKGHVPNVILSRQ
jgi:hypothetical protein